MPVQVSYPGVYIQEVSSGVNTITGVSTSIAAFFGRATKGPLNKAVRLLSLADFEREFGAPHPQSELAHSVRLFFANGGTDCYVVRLANGAQAAAVTLTNDDDSAVLTATAKAEGAWGNTVRLEVDYATKAPEETFNLTVINEQGGNEVGRETFTGLSMDQNSPRFAPTFVSQSSSLINLTLEADLSGGTAGFSESRLFLAGNAAAVIASLNGLVTATSNSFQISVNGSAFVPVTIPTPLPGTLVGITDLFTSTINEALDDVFPVHTVNCEFIGADPRRLRITANTGANNNPSVRIRRAAQNDLAVPLMLGLDQGGVEPNRYRIFRPSANGAVLSSGATLATLNTFATTNHNALTGITVDGTAVPLNLGGATPMYQHTGGGGDGVREAMNGIAQAINNTATLNWSASVWGYQLALTAKTGNPSSTPTVVFTGPGAAALNPGFEINARYDSLGSGTPGLDGSAPQPSDYLGSENEQTGFHALDSVDLFNLMVLPADEEVDLSTVWGPASTYCAGKRAFLLIDPPSDWTDNAGRPAVVQNNALINNLRAQVISDYSAVYYPRILISDNGLRKTVGPTGAIAGLYARTDTNRGVWKAPAGTEATLNNILGLNLKLTDLENGVLNKQGVNCLREFPGSFVSWGARTMDGSDDAGSEWKYVPIRRLALFIEESLFRGTKWVVFEPNDEPLWSRIRMNLGAFMNGLFRQGAFQGATPDQAFFVKCDGETTTANDRNLGIVNIQVGFAPLKPAEFVVITIQQIADVG